MTVRPTGKRFGKYLDPVLVPNVDSHTTGVDCSTFIKSEGSAEKYMILLAPSAHKIAAEREPGIEI